MKKELFCKKYERLLHFISRFVLNHRTFNYLLRLESSLLKKKIIIKALCYLLPAGDCADLDLEMKSGTISDNNITASSELNVNTPAKNGRLNYTAGSSWCASNSDSNPYLQIDLQTLHIICAVSTQGNSQGDQWVEIYTLQSSSDGTTWTDYKKDGQVKVVLCLRVYFNCLV